MDPSLLYRRAKAMRKGPTEAERRLWAQLRGKRLNGFKFYRQVVVGTFIVDFISHERGVVVEVDGVTHGDASDVAYDARRTRVLEALGLIVHRVPNFDVFMNMDGVLYGVLLVLEARPCLKGCVRAWL
jgi:very-short-patch-repair endonuclease